MLSIRSTNEAASNHTPLASLILALQKQASIARKVCLPRLSTSCPILPRAGFDHISQVNQVVSTAWEPKLPTEKEEKDLVSKIIQKLESLSEEEIEKKLGNLEQKLAGLAKRLTLTLDPQAPSQAIDYAYSLLGKIHPIHAYFHDHEVTTLFDDCRSYLDTHEAFLETTLEIMKETGHKQALEIRQNASVRKEFLQQIMRNSTTKLKACLIDINSPHAEAFFLAQTAKDCSEATNFSEAIENLKNYLVHRPLDPTGFSPLLQQISTTWKAYDELLMRHHQETALQLKATAQVWF